MRRDWRRLAVVVGAGLLGSLISIYFWSLPHVLPSDFAQIWAGARALLRSDSPYAVVGPDKAFAYGWRTPYPLPAFLIGLPFALVPLKAANALFIGLSSAALASALTRTQWNDPRLVAFASFAYLHAAQPSQWSPVLTAAALTPSLGFILAAKPTIGLALWMGYPSLRTAAAVIGMFGLSFLVRPTWVAEWRPTLGDLNHLRAPIMFTGGPLLFLALLRWRLPEARLLVGLACAPQSTFLYEVLPLFLVARRVEEAVAISGLTFLTHAVWDAGPKEDFTSTTLALGQSMVWLIYLPCLAIVLRRPNAWASHDLARLQTLTRRFPVLNKVFVESRHPRDEGTSRG